MRRGEGGASLVEVLIALAILTILVTGLVPSFIAFLEVNTRNEARTEAVQAAQVVLESLRRSDVATIPTTGASPPRAILVGHRTYQVVTRYCEVPEYCDTDSRHLAIEVRNDGDLLYTAETVFTALR